MKNPPALKRVISWIKICSGHGLPGTYSAKAGAYPGGFFTKTLCAPTRSSLLFHLIAEALIKQSDADIRALKLISDGPIS
jgi:hypothetical protein